MAAMLTFILAATIAAPLSALHLRLEGWALSAGVAIWAQLLLWPVRPQGLLRSDAARACLALADLAHAVLGRAPQEIADRTHAAGVPLPALVQRFLHPP